MSDDTALIPQAQVCLAQVPLYCSPGKLPTTTNWILEKNLSFLRITGFCPGIYAYSFSFSSWGFDSEKELIMYGHREWKMPNLHILKPGTKLEGIDATIQEKSAYL